MPTVSSPSQPAPETENLDRKIREVWISASPKAGSGAGRHQIDRLVTRLRGNGIDCHVTHSIEALQKRIADPSTSTAHFAVVAAGGDGTVALIAQNIPREIPIVPMPMGTENLLARHWGFSPDAVDVAATIERGERFVMDAGLANGRLFLVMVTAGMDAEVVRGMHLTRRGHIRRWSYTRPILRAISRYAYPLIRSVEAVTPAPEPGSETTISADTDDIQQPPIEACWMMAFNLPRYAAGLGIEPNAKPDDGLLDVIAMRRGFFWSGLNYLARIKLGWHLSHPDVSRRRVRRVTWTAPTRVPYQVDGDYAGRLPVEIEVLPARVTLLRPAIA
ncbi:diacylglycerol/lipid kinase family protein [Aporhodopirellula aestuarii]|uniref:Protein BmrU n=1 Tax=Aporhodopirellula aestuarii TaxID=2950107 RepID=A0ABT0UD97_9BACT|nr:diacylglycerol kinase family protein [Aporhodopirellula aestuarii]MCM2374261.1 protein BmrU [Aporhodopirellula aestuarii]